MQDKFIKTAKRIVIFGCGGHARSIANVINELVREEEIIFVDKNARNGELIYSWRVEQTYNLNSNDVFIVAIGNNDNRKQLYQILIKQQVGSCISVISIYANIGFDVQIGQGTFIAQNVYIGPQVEIGNNTIINTGSVVEHETIIGNHTHIAPHATICGRTKIGNNVFCGAGSTVIDRIKICDNVVIGAGAVVVNDIIESGTYVGIPAKKYFK